MPNHQNKMEMKKITKCFILLFLVVGQWISGKAQEKEHTQTIRGSVIDLDSKSELIGANVIVLGVEPILGSSTDIEGAFRITNVPIGRYTLKVSYMGYEDNFIPEVNVGSGKEIVLTIELKELTTKLEELVFVAQAEKDQPVNEMATVSARSFTVDEASRYAGSFSDPARMASAYAGVVSNNSFTNEITVRGNSPKGLLWRLEGVEIPTPNHLSGYSKNGGVVTVLSTNAMSNSDFMTGAYPSEYGNATSGVFDIKLRNGNNEKKEYAFQASLFGIEAAMEGPINKGSKASYLFNYRYATTSVLGDIGLLNKNEGLPTWQDFTLKINIPSKKIGDLQLFAIGGLSGVNETAQKDSSEWEYEYNSENNKFHSNMGVIGASNRYFINNDTYIKTIIAATIRDTGHHSDSLDNEYVSHFNGKSSTKDYSQTISSYINHKFNARSVVRTGIIFNRKAYDVFAEDRNIVAPYNMKVLVDSEGSYQYFQSYIQWKYRIKQNIELNTGVHYLNTAFNDNSSLEPRAGIRWYFKNNQSLSFGYGIHSRLEPSTIYFEQIQVGGETSQPNIHTKLGKSSQYVISYDRSIAEHLRLKLEAYLQKQYNIPIEDNPLSSYSTINNDVAVTGVVLVNEGTATSKGIELTLEKFLDRNYYFLITGSLYDSKYKAGDGIERNTKYNGKFVGNVLIGREFTMTNNRSIGVDFRFVIAGGNRITPINLEQSRINGTTVYYEEKAFSDQTPTYFRPDFKISYTKNKTKIKKVISLDIQNITNYQNELTPYFDGLKNDIVKEYQFGMLPNISYKIIF